MHFKAIAYINFSLHIIFIGVLGEPETVNYPPNWMDTTNIYVLADFFNCFWAS